MSASQDSDEPPLTSVLAVPKGQAMGGQFFPLLFDPTELT